MRLPVASTLEAGLAAAGADLELRLAVGNTPAPCAHERAVDAEFVDPIIAVVGHEDITRGVTRHRTRVVELASTSARESGGAASGTDLELRLAIGDAPAPRASKFATRGELVNTLVVVISDEHVAGGVRADARGGVHLAGPSPPLPVLARACTYLETKPTGDTPAPRPQRRHPGLMDNMTS